MAVSTTLDFQKEVQKLFDLFDNLEIDKLKDMFSDDAQGVDEISRQWLRGKDAMNGYFAQLAEMGISDIHSDLSDVEVKQWDDVALVTCIADQTYKVGGDQVTIKAPGSFLFRRNNGSWRLELVHAVPLPDAD
ncbi:MAG: nuclear transport factor 2 family protein [Acidimicrobiia bacterium]|nr:nuclear transport factor 2 family protein [Acidimicrobiia bacterium]NNC42766.1 SnoaL-like domain-containing protein [Acidimicrobiia bacterium]